MSQVEGGADSVGDVLMIKSKSWEISAWNPKDSAMFGILSGGEETGVREKERVGGRDLVEGCTIYPKITHIGIHCGPFENFRPRSNGKSRWISAYHVIAN